MSSFGTLESYDHAGRYTYGSLSGITISTENTTVCCTPMLTGTFVSLKNATTDNVTVYLSQYLSYNGCYNYSADNDSIRWMVGAVGSDYFGQSSCGGSGTAPENIFGNGYGPGQYGGPAGYTETAAFSAWVR
jgi:hypothetical protein